MVCIWVYILSINRLSPCAVCESSIFCVDPCDWPQLCMYVYARCVRGSVGNTCSASLLAGLEAMEPQQPPLSWDTGYDKH